MGFKNISLKVVVPLVLLGLVLVGGVFWKIFDKADLPVSENSETQDSFQNESIKEISSNSIPETQVVREVTSVSDKQENDAIQKQLDQDLLDQKEAKDLKFKLEQTNLELEEEKALAELNKLKNDNKGVISEGVESVQNNLPEIKVDYIGGDSIKREAIISIAGTSYQVKEKSNPTDNIQVVSISDSDVTLRFSTPQNLTKTIDYKPE